MKHLGSLESTQEARVALGYALSNSYTSFVLSKLPACFISRWMTYEPIVNCSLGNCGIIIGLLFVLRFLLSNSVASNLYFRWYCTFTNKNFSLHYQYSIKHTSDKNKKESSITCRKLLVDLILNSPNWHHKYFMADSKENC